jgi:hypothetical protein
MRTSGSLTVTREGICNLIGMDLHADRDGHRGPSPFHMLMRMFANKEIQATLRAANSAQTARLVREGPTTNDRAGRPIPGGIPGARTARREIRHSINVRPTQTPALIRTSRLARQATLTASGSKCQGAKSPVNVCR